MPEDKVLSPTVTEMESHLLQAGACFYSGGDGCHFEMDGRHLAYGNMRENAIRHAYAKLKEGK